MFLRRGIQQSLKHGWQPRRFTNSNFIFPSTRGFTSANNNFEKIAKNNIEGVWRAPGSKFDIEILASDLDQNPVAFLYKEHLRSGASVTCPLKKKGDWFEGVLGPDWKVRFKLDQQQNVVRQNGSAKSWGEEVLGELCYDSESEFESDVEDSHEKFATRGATCKIGDKQCESDMAWGAEDTGKYKRKKASTWRNPTQNHIWQKEDLDKILEQSLRDAPEHKPQTFGDKTMYFFVKTLLYNGFNTLTRFNPHDPTPNGCAWRVLFLESIAGVPGMVSACLRHFRSLKNLERDHGWIHTLLEEAENERMHLLIAMKMFNAGPLLRYSIIASQYVFTTVLVAAYIVQPQLLHRFVGYLEECAVSTYSMMVKATETEGTQLNKEWKHLPAPPIAKGYYRLDDDATWVDCLRCILADESHHRDVNHTFAGMKANDSNPFLGRHHADQFAAWQLNQPYRDHADHVPIPVAKKVRDDINLTEKSGIKDKDVIKDSPAASKKQ